MCSYNSFEVETIPLSQSDEGGGLEEIRTRAADPETALVFFFNIQFISELIDLLTQPMNLCSSS